VRPTLRASARGPTPNDAPSIARAAEPSLVRLRGHAARAVNAAPGGRAARSWAPVPATTTKWWFATTAALNAAGSGIQGVRCGRRPRRGRDCVALAAGRRKRGAAASAARVVAAIRKTTPAAFARKARTCLRPSRRASDSMRQERPGAYPVAPQGQGRCAACVVYAARRGAWASWRRSEAARRGPGGVPRELRRAARPGRRDARTAAVFGAGERTD
jgi:hypothetical protein